MVNGWSMSGIVTAKASAAAGGAPTSALAVESESKHGRREGLCRPLHFSPPILRPNILYLHPVTYQLTTGGETETGNNQLFLVKGVHLPPPVPRLAPALGHPASVAAPAALAPSVAPSPPPAAQLVPLNSCEDALAVISAVRPRGRAYSLPSVKSRGCLQLLRQQPPVS